MEQLLEIQKRLVPELLNDMHRRYRILRQIQWMQPVGRRALAGALDMTERVLRAETDFLREQGLIRVDSAGMKLTEAGQSILTDAEPFIREMAGLRGLEERLASVLGIRRAIIVPGDSDHSAWVKKEMGRAAARLLAELAEPDGVIAVSGGSSVLELAEELPAHPVLKTVTFVPTRGGMGERVELEANWIVSRMAMRTGSSYRLLHVPEELGDEAYQTMIREPRVREVLEKIRQARIVVHGIGDARAMARRRGSPEEVVEKLVREGAVGESFGYYFNQNGDIVHRVRTIGLRLEDLIHVKRIVAVAGGSGKAEAIRAVCGHVSRDVLVTDEGAARAVLKMEEPVREC
ncbi:sugar-binding transcriptional regulator [Staphylospora marina]|uniref:sugar-binding transcriptional regulator n=1 Tax=Staphylospora marina TaxID=2490858 RepID=UPI000F5B9E0B|nr:sugar-binding domain-containing protein [Staphylospora marina]